MNEPGYNQTTRPVKPSYFQQRDILTNLLERVQDNLIVSEDAEGFMQFEVYEKHGDICLRIWKDNILDVRIFVTDEWTENAERYQVFIWEDNGAFEIGVSDEEMIDLFCSKMLQNAYEWMQDAIAWACYAVNTVETYMGKAWLQFHLSKAKGGCITINYPNQEKLNNDIPTDFLSLTDPKTPARVAWIDINPIEV